MILSLFFLEILKITLTFVELKILVTKTVQIRTKVLLKKYFEEWDDNNFVPYMPLFYYSQVVLVKDETNNKS